jgi:DNA-binding transcriptional regulator YiaG
MKRIIKGGTPLCAVPRGELILLPDGSPERYGVVAKEDLEAGLVRGLPVRVERADDDDIAEWRKCQEYIRKLREPAPGTKYVTAAGIHALQNHLGLTELEFARLFNVNPSTVHRWKKGQVPHRRFLRKLEKMIAEMEGEIGEDLEEHFTSEEIERAEKEVTKILND